MELFVRKHEKKINATLGCFDRMLFRGYLPIQSGWAMAQFLNQEDIRCPYLKDFLSENADRINDHAKTLAKKLGRPFQYLTAPTRKEDLARKMAENEDIKHGLVCIFSVLEPCRSFSFKFKIGRPYVQPARRKCLGSLRTRKERNDSGTAGATFARRTVTRARSPRVVSGAPQQHKLRTKTSVAVRSRYNNLKVATAVCVGRGDLWELNWKLFQWSHLRCMF